MSSSSDIQEAPTQGSNDHLLAAVLSQQTEMFNKMMLMFNQHQSGNSGKSAPDLDQSFESLPDSTESREEIEDASSTTSTRSPDAREEELRAKIANAQRELAALQGKDCEGV